MIKHWYKLHKIITIPLNLHSKILVALHCNHLKLCIYLQLVFVSPVSRPQKDRKKTGLRLEKTRPAVRFFDF